MIATVDISVQAANPSMPLFPMRAFQGSPSSIRVRNVPKRIGDWVIDKVYFAVTYPDNTNQTIECKLVGGVYVGTVEGCATIGDVKNGYSIFADGKDENGNVVTNYCLGKGDVQILDAGGITQPLQNTTFVQILSAHPATPNDGDMWHENDAWYIWQNGQANSLGLTEDDLSAYATKTIEDTVTKTYELPIEWYDDNIGTTLFFTKIQGSKITWSEYNTTLTYDIETHELAYTSYNGKSFSIGEYTPEDIQQHVQDHISFEYQDEETSYTLYPTGLYPYDFDITVTKDVMYAEGGADILNEFQTKLTDTQISAIDSVVDERATIVKHLDNTVSSYNIEGTLTNKSIPTISEAVEVHIGRGVTDIGSSAFNGLNNLTTVSIPDSIKSIGTFAFWGCGGLTSVTIPGSITSIGEAAFQRCSALSTVNINDGVSSIAEGAFSGCTSLTSVTIPDSVTDIGTGAFQGCSSLTSVDIGNGINNMGDSVFADCNALTSVTFKDTTMLFIQSVATYPFGINNPTTVIKTWNAASQEWVRERDYATNFKYNEAFIIPFGRLMNLTPYAVNTFTVNSAQASFTISVSGTAGTLMRELYFTLTLGSGVTSQPIAWNAAIDVFQGGSADAVAPVTGVNIYHILEYTSGHFMVEKIV